MFCPQCRGEYRDDINACAHCEIPLVAELPPEDTFASEEAMAASLADKDVQALVTGSHVGLREAQHFLASQRVASTIAGEQEEQVEQGMHERFFLIVAAEDGERAKTLLQQRWRAGLEAQGMAFQDVSSTSAGVCPACGTSVSETITECPECGLFLGEAEGASAP